MLQKRERGKEKGVTEGREPRIKGTLRGYRKGKGVTEWWKPRIKGTLRGYRKG